MPERSYSNERLQNNRLSRRRLLRNTTATAVAIGAIPFATQKASAHFPTELSIDVQPGNEENFIDLDEHETIEVVVNPSQFVNSDGDVETFDPVERPIRYRFGSWDALDDGDGAHPTGDTETVETKAGHGGDGSVESLLLEFPVSEMGLEGGEEAVWLYWERDDSGEHGYAGVGKARVYSSQSLDQGFVQMITEAVGDPDDS